MRQLSLLSLFLVLLSNQCIASQQLTTTGAASSQGGKVLVLPVEGGTASSYLNPFSFDEDVQRSLKKIRTDNDFIIDFARDIKLNDLYQLQMNFYSKNQIDTNFHGIKYTYIIGLKIVGFDTIDTVVYDIEAKRYYSKNIGYKRYFQGLEMEETFYKNIKYAFAKFINNRKTQVVEGVPTNNDDGIKESKESKSPFPSQKIFANTERVKSKPVNKNSIAVIIGNKNYSKNNPDVPDVDFALNDAELMYQFVTKKLGFREGNVIYLKDATQADLIRTFGVKGNAEGNLYDWVRPNKSEVFVYYSGHGAPGISNGQGYLLPVDADPHKVELNGYSLGTLYNNLSQIPAKEMTIIMDTCFSGGSANGSVIRNASSIALRRIETEAQLPNAAILTATGLSEVASWDKNQKLGLFTRHFFAGVNGTADKENFGNGDGKVTLGELKNYLEDEVTYQARRQYGRKQHPNISGEYERVIVELN